MTGMIERTNARLAAVARGARGAISRLVLASGLALGLAGAAQAATITVTYQGSGPFGTPNYSRYLQIASAPYSGGVFAGPFRLTGSGGMGNFVAFCVDLAKFLGSGHSYSTSASSGYGAAVDSAISKLFNSAYAGISNAVQGAAFQVALWEIITDTGTGYDLSSGGFSATYAPYSSAVLNQANLYLSALNTAPSSGYSLTFLNSGSSQNLVTVAQIPAVPLPASVGMMGLALGALTLIARRRRKAP